MSKRACTQLAQCVLAFSIFGLFTMGFCLHPPLESLKMRFIRQSVHLKSHMMAAVLYGREQLRVEPVAIPAIQDGDLLVRVKVALTCGTDVKVFRRGYHARMIRPPAVFGHEFAGVVDAVGPEVEDFVPGDRVAAANSAPCGACFFCRRLQAELCEDLQFLNGAYAEYIVIPERLVKMNMLRIPDHVDFDQAALSEPLACVVHGMRDTGVGPGETVAVIGAGPIGLMFIAMCKRAGAPRVAVRGRAARLRLAAELGADLSLSANDSSDIVSAVRDASEAGRGADRVLECV